MRDFLLRSDGVTAIEYGLVAALVATAILGAVSALGQNVYTLLFENVANAM